MAGACTTVTVLLVALLGQALHARAGEPKPVRLGPLSAVPPAEWAREKPANLLRSAQFKLKSADEALAPAELAVFPESSPKVKAKFEEWRATFVPPAGKPADEPGTVTTFELPKATTTHRLDVSGTWKYRERPRDPKSKEELRPEYRVIWVILVNEDETTHVRLSGPATTVEAHRAAFEAWLKSAK